MRLMVCAASLETEEQARQLATSLALPYQLGVTPAPDNVDGWLCWDTTGLRLQLAGPRAPGSIGVDFTEGANQHRRQFGGGKGQLIAKAVGLKGSYRPLVLDATAGLGGDAFVLACLGCQLRLIERSPVVYALLADGLQRARKVALNDPEIRAIIDRMQLLSADSLDYMSKLPVQEQPDVVYLDPMFPERSKSAAVKKSMAVFHQLVGQDKDADGLLDASLAVARYRVVVKRPSKAPFLAGRSPHHQLQGKSCRYDLYTLQKMP